MVYAIETQGLVKSYGALTAVDHLDLTVATGSIYALLGPNGAGKTTAVEILEGIRTLSRGRARVLGEDVANDYARVRSRIGALPQDFEPFDRLSPLETVLYWSRLFGRSLSRPDAVRLLEAVGLQERMGVPALRLSGGEKRKLGMAIALVPEPELLFLDEPTTGLDPSARREVWQLVRGVRKEGRTVLLTTHYLDEAEQLADDVGILHRGRLVAEGRPEELIARNAGRTLIVLGGAGAAGLREVEAEGFPARLDREDVLVPVADPTEMRAALGRLAALRTPFADMYTRRSSLEDVFLQIVGSRMEEGVLQA